MVGNEVIKNVLLSGVKHMTILDDTLLTEEEIWSQFLAPYSDVGLNKAKSCLLRAKELNPMVDIIADTDSIDNKSDDYFKNFTIVCMTGYSNDTQVRVNEICHRIGVKFLSGNVFGYYGYMFADLGTHRYVVEKQKVIEHKKGQPAAKKAKTIEPEDVEMEEKVSNYCSLAEAEKQNFTSGKSLRQIQQVTKTYLVMKVLHAYSQKFNGFPKELKGQQTIDDLLDTRNEVLESLQLDSDMLPDCFASQCIGELCPVNAIVGGILSQEVIKAVSGKDAPHENFFFYDGNATSGVVLKIAPEAEEKPKSEDGQQAEEIL